MADETPHAPGAHEKSDVRLKPIVYGAAALAVIAVVVLLLMAGLFGVFKSQDASSQTPQTPIAQGPRPQSAAPRLQVGSTADLAQLRRAEAEKLSRYDWVDRKQGIITVPIERAMELVARDGVPEWKDGN
jgi:hypothetical protein